MAAVTKSPIDHVVSEHAGAAIGDHGACMDATQAKNVVLELARSLARMAAREDDAAECGGHP